MKATNFPMGSQNLAEKPFDQKCLLKLGNWVGFMSGASISVEDLGRYCSDRDSLGLPLKNSCYCKVKSSRYQVVWASWVPGLRENRFWRIFWSWQKRYHVLVWEPPGMEWQWCDRAKRKAEEEKGKKAAKDALHAVTV
jgi:hypothetical protein